MAICYYTSERKQTLIVDIDNLINDSCDSKNVNSESKGEDKAAGELRKLSNTLRIVYLSNCLLSEEETITGQLRKWKFPLKDTKLVLKPYNVESDEGWKASKILRLIRNGNTILALVGELASDAIMSVSFDIPFICNVAYQTKEEILRKIPFNQRHLCHFASDWDEISDHIENLMKGI